MRRTDPSKGEGPNWRGVVLFLGMAALLLMAFYAHQSQTAASMRELTFAEFENYLKAGRVKEVMLNVEPSANVRWLSGKFDPPEGLRKSVRTDSQGLTGFKVTVDLEFKRDLEQVLAANGFPNVSQKVIDNSMWQALAGTLPFVLFILIMYFFFRQQIRMAGKSAFSFGKSKARILSKDKNKVTFADVAGIEEAKDEVSEIVEFLRDPKKFQKLGGRIPKGILMVGPPGTGKTLLAKAIAGEADVPFYGISGSDFVEMFVGVGASRVRDMFEQGKKTAPCLIFIDEIDAVGRSRGHGLGGGHDEREQTLNALLVEMDGIDTAEGVIIIAATNRKDVLDPALLRPGRFDREVHINLPDVKGREEILKVHAKKVKAAPEVCWSTLARSTPGFSGAELANVINEAALLAARRDAEAITQKDLEEARDKVRYGRERRSLAMSDEQKKLTAYHEAGHALLNIVLEHTDPLHKVSIIPRGPALGVTMMLPTEDRYGYGKRKVTDDLCVAMGGRVAEEMFLGDISSGASGDIKMATWYAKKMVCEWGMSGRMGMVEYGDHEDYVFLGREIGRSRGYSEATAREIDEEVHQIVNTAYERAKKILGENREKVEKIAAALLEYETLDGSQVEEIVKHGRILNPPPKGLSAPSAPTPSEPLPVNRPVEKVKDKGTILPGLEGAPAGA
ncbi:ATP-dependent metallopeptidase FtsH/Yme1/Tma family protein [bacterium]|nr:ATP-dependent metallopeptidase FtsH/Yme1/Tma family protein [bacterium]NDD81631.1 ATP-dependent metallopeptidase FtsH/Yme1/Tma family protein [Verrucomicrobiota bacterium]